MRSIRQEDARNFARNSVFRSLPPPLTNWEGWSAIRGTVKLRENPQDKGALSKAEVAALGWILRYSGENPDAPPLLPK